MSQKIACPKCGKENLSSRYFCSECGSLLDKSSFSDEKVYEQAEIKIFRILENLDKTPHSRVLWDDTVDMYTRKVLK